MELARVPGPVELAALLAELEASGIKAMSSADDVGRMRPSMAFAQGYRVLVFEGDVVRAREVLRGIELDPTTVRTVPANRRPRVAPGAVPFLVLGMAVIVLPALAALYAWLR